MMLMFTAITALGKIEPLQEALFQRSPAFRRSHFPPIAVLASRGGEEVWFSSVCVLVLGFIGFRCSFLSIMVGQMIMVFLEIKVFQFKPLLVGSVANANERLVESKLLK
jgi:hypothetical protein